MPWANVSSGKANPNIVYYIGLKSILIVVIQLV